MITLEYAGTEKSLADWGFQAPIRSLVSQGADTFTVNLATRAVDADELIPFEAQVIVRTGRTRTNNAFTGGTVIFRGRRILTPLTAQPAGERVGLQFANAWYDLEHLCYQQPRKNWSGTEEALVDVYTSELILFFDWETAGKLNTGEQLTRILQYAIDQGAPLQIGTIEVAVNVPTYQVKDLMCSEAIVNCLRSAPDATVYWDYTTTPPTIHVRKRASLEAVTLPFADGIKHQSSAITPRPDLSVPAVSLKFKRTNEQNGFVWVERMDQPPNWQLYPESATGRERRCLVQTIDLAGFQRSDIYGSLVTTAVTAQSLSESSRAAFWIEHKSEFGEDNILNFKVTSAKIIDAVTKQPVSLAEYPNELVDGQIAAWMTLDDNTPVTGRRVKVFTEASYEQIDVVTKRILKIHTSKEITTEITLTNGITGDYSALQSFVSGEEIPVGLAQSIYESLAAPQFQGSHTIVEAEITHSIGMEHVLNLAGGREEWETMKASVVSIREEFNTGSTTVEFGPPLHLGAGDLVQLFLFNRDRQVWQNPTTFNTGQAGAGNTVSLGKNMPKADTTSGSSDKSLDTVRGPAIAGDKYPEIRSDGRDDPTLTIQQVQYNNAVATAGQVIMRLSEAAGKEIRFRSWEVCRTNPTTGAQQRGTAIFLSSEFIP